MQEGRLLKSQLNSADTYIVDCGSEMFVWIGKGSNPDEKKSAMANAQVRRAVPPALCAGWLARCFPGYMRRCAAPPAVGAVCPGTGSPAVRAGVRPRRWPPPPSPVHPAHAGFCLGPQQNMLVSQGRNTVRVNRIVEFAETPLFKSKFFQWDPPASFDFTAPRSTGIAGVRGRASLCSLPGVPLTLQ